MESNVAYSIRIHMKLHHSKTKTNLMSAAPYVATNVVLESDVHTSGLQSTKSLQLIAGVCGALPSVGEQ